MLHITQTLSRPGAAVNEDRIWCDHSRLALLDGSTSLVPSAFDGSWFTGSFVEGLAASDAGDLPERVNQALAHVEALYRAERPETEPEYYPSAAGIFVQERGADLEILAIGDCVGYFFMADGRMMRITDKTVTRLDQEVLDLCQTLRDQTGQTIAALLKTDEVRQRLLENRKKMNRPEGYRILAFNMRPCTAGDLILLPAREVRRIVLFSDGFDAVQDRLMKPDISLEQLYQDLRQMEREDPDFQRLPRFKPSDDASALEARLEA